MKRRVIKHKENLWTSRQKQKANPQAHEAMAKGVELHHLLKYLQMHFRSSLRGLTGCKTSKMSNLTSWLLSKNRWIYFQPSLTASLHNSSLLAILVKKGEIWSRSSSWGGASFWGGETLSIFMFYLWFFFLFMFGFSFNIDFIALC